MRNRIAQQRQRDYFERASQTVNGQERTLLLFSSSAEVMQRIGNVGQLPVEENTTALQDEDGNFFFLFGYSEFGGGDIIP